jgi:hypothetical protein
MEHPRDLVGLIDRGAATSCKIMSSIPQPHWHKCRPERFMRSTHASTVSARGNRTATISW